MKLIDVNAEAIEDTNNPLATIKLTAKFEDTSSNFRWEIVLKDCLRVDVKQLLNEIERVEKDHPYFKLKLCESPIELKFFVYAMRDIPNLKPQVVIGPYRVDLAIPEKKVVIELDGHAFHSSRQQRTRDAKRARYIQMQGWQVIRFTGTEIHQGVVECINEAKQIIEKLPNRM
jgi:very-short-patch-repair endonuclease